jgi:hypothetical protein
MNPEQFPTYNALSPVLKTQTTSIIHIRRCHIMQGFMVPMVVVVINKQPDLMFKL